MCCLSNTCMHTSCPYKDFYGGYHDGAVAADNDYSSGKLDFHGCPADTHNNIVKDMRLDIVTKGDSIYEGNSEVIYCLARHVSQGVVALSEDINGRKNQALFLVM